jgi:hypothetical protein
MNRKIISRHFLLSSAAILIYLALLKLIIHFLTNGNYGYFRDEFYYIACSDHLAWGYVDQPPLSIFILAINRLLLGDSIFALRLLPALAGALTVIITGLMVRQLGGGRFAQALAALAVIITGVYLSLNSFYSMNSFDLLFWALSFYILILIIKKDKPKLWLLFGLVAGLGLMNKYSMLFFGFGLLGGLLLTSHRKYLLSKWFWLAALIAFVIVLPHIIWEIQYDFPSIEFMRNASQYKIYPVSPLEFLSGQLLLLSFINAPLCLVGLYYYFFHKDGKTYRLFGWIFIIILIIMITLKAKVYYIAPVYSMLFASGALVTEKFIHKLKWRWLKPAFISLMIIAGIIVSPIAIPVLPVETFIKYAEFMGIVAPKMERSETSALPQHFADRFGWENMVDTLAQVYHTLTPEEQSQCILFARNYGQAGAIDFFGEKYDLPKATCSRNNYWLWGPGERSGEIAICIGYRGEIKENVKNLKQYFHEVEHAATIKCKYCMPHENYLPIFICRKPKIPLKEVWESLKVYI